MSTSIEAQGHTVDEAIQIALNQLGVSRDKVEIDILHHPRRGVLGIGARRAKVRATIRESVMADGEEFDMSGDTDLDDKPRRRRRRGGRNRSGGRDGDAPESPGDTTPRPAAAAAAAAPREQVRGDGGRDAGRGRGGDGGRSRDDRRGGGGRGRGDQRGGERAAGPEGRPDNQPPRGGQQQRGSQRGGQQGRGQDQRRGSDQQRGSEQQRGPESQRGGDQQRGADQQRGSEAPRDGGREDSRDRSSQRGGRQGARDQGDRRDAGRSEGDRRDAGRSGRSDTAGAAAFDDLSSRPEGSGPQATEQSRSGQIVSPRRPSADDEPPLDAETLELVRARAEELVKELLQKMGFPAEVTSTIDEAAGEAVVSVRSESEGLLIGRRGQTLDSLEHIVNRMTLRAEAYVEGRVLLDIGDYRKRRRESLDELASRLRARAVGERRTVQVSPMSPRDRRFFAQAFADDESVEVRSLGAGFYRRVIVAPAGMAASAVAAAEAAGEVEDDAVETDSGFAGTEAES